MRTLLVLALVCSCDSSTTPAPAKVAAKPEAKSDAKPDAKPAAKAEVKPETAAKPPEPAASPGLTWTIEAEPKTTKLADIDKLRLRVTVTNGSGVVAAPSRVVRSFTVDGKSSTALSLAFGNGGRSKVWSELPPGESVDESRIGVAFADTAGDHTIAMSDGEGNELARTVVHFDP